MQEACFNDDVKRKRGAQEIERAIALLCTRVCFLVTRQRCAAAAAAAAAAAMAAAAVVAAGGSCGRVAGGGAVSVSDGE